MAYTLGKPTDHGTCPTGALWYECTVQTPSFQGCCTSNPCNGGAGCPASDLRPAGIPENGVVATNEPNVLCDKAAGFQWWTCSAQNPSFQGCCKSNPCNGVGCPSTDLGPAQFKVIPGASTTLQSSTGSASSTTGPTGSPTAGANVNGVTNAADQHTVVAHKDNTPIIAGVVVGGVVLIALMGFLFWFLRGRKKHPKKEKDPAAQAMVDGLEAMTPDNAVNGNNEGFYAVGVRPANNPSKLTSNTPSPPNPNSPGLGPPPYPNSPHMSEVSHLSPNTPGFNPHTSGISDMSWRNSNVTGIGSVGFHEAGGSERAAPQMLDGREMVYAVELPGSDGVAGSNTGKGG